MGQESRKMGCHSRAPRAVMPKAVLFVTSLQVWHDMFIALSLCMQVTCSYDFSAL